MKTRTIFCISLSVDIVSSHIQTQNVGWLMLTQSHSSFPAGTRSWRALLRCSEVYIVGFAAKNNCRGGGGAPPHMYVGRKHQQWRMAKIRVLLLAIYRGPHAHTQSSPHAIVVENATCHHTGMILRTGLIVNKYEVHLHILWRSNYPLYFRIRLV